MMTRILVAVICLPLLLFVVLGLPAWATAILFGLLAVIAVYELLWPTKILRNKRIIAYSMCMAALTVFYSYTSTACADWTQGLSVGARAAVLLYFALLFCELLAAHTELKIAPVCVAAFGGIVIPWLLAALVRVRTMDGGRYFILIAFILSMVADSAAYFVGRALGKHKLAPIISPKKTVEGAVGGVVFTVLAMLLYAFLLKRCFGFTRVNYFYAALYGAIGSIGSILGDLTFSVIKRQSGVKDYGNLLPGHGGVLDRFDSTLIVAPLTEVLLLLLPIAVR